MKKVLINLLVPLIDQRFDVLIPRFFPIKAASQLRAKMLVEVSVQRYISSGYELLCSVEQNLLFRQEYTLGDYNVQNGEHLLFS